MTASRWDEIHVRRDVPHHAMRIHEATEFELTDLEDEPAELEQLRWSRWVQAEAAQLVEAAVIDARRAGASWATVGAVMGLNKQTAWERYRYLDLDAPFPDDHPRARQEPEPEPPRSAPVHNPPKKSRRKRK